MGWAFRHPLTLVAEGMVAEGTVAVAMAAVATWVEAIWGAVILAAVAGVATASQDAAVIGADMAAATVMDMADAIHITDAGTAPALLVV